MDDIERDFTEFHLANPLVYETLVKLTREAKEIGFAVIGIKMLWEVMRWEMTKLHTKDGATEFKLCNNYHALYARIIMAQEPDLVGMFRLRGDRPTPAIAQPVKKRQITRTPSARTLQQQKEAIGPIPTTARGNLRAVAGAGDSPGRPRRTRGASSTGTGRTHEERELARQRGRERRAAENSARAV